MALTLEDPQKVPKPKYEATAIQAHPSIQKAIAPKICFTICLFISPDLDGYRAPKMTHHGMDLMVDHQDFVTSSGRFRSRCPSATQHVTPPAAVPTRGNAGDRRVGEDGQPLLPAITGGALCSSNGPLQNSRIHKVEQHFATF